MTEHVPLLPVRVAQFPDYWTVTEILELTSLRCDSGGMLLPYFRFMLFGKLSLGVVGAQMWTSAHLRLQMRTALGQHYVDVEYSFSETT